MPRQKRSDNEIRQFGLPTLEERLIAVEELLQKIISLVQGIPANSKKSFEDHQAKMNDIDLKHPPKN